MAQIDVHKGVRAVMESTNMLANSVQVATQARAAGVTVMFAPISFAKEYREITADPYGILKGVVDANAFVRGTWGLRSQTFARILTHTEFLSDLGL